MQWWGHPCRRLYHNVSLICGMIGLCSALVALRLVFRGADLALPVSLCRSPSLLGEGGGCWALERMLVLGIVKGG